MRKRMLVCWHSCEYLSPALSSWSPIPFVIRTYKPTESDLEDDDDEEDDEDEDSTNVVASQLRHFVIQVRCAVLVIAL